MALMYGRCCHAAGGLSHSASGRVVPLVPRLVTPSSGKHQQQQHCQQSTVRQVLLAPCQARLREVEAVDFPGVFEALVESVQAGKALPKQSVLLMIQSISSVDQARRALALLDRYLQSRLAAGAPDDWALRKKYMQALCEVAAVRLQYPPLVWDIFANTQRFALSTYFARDVIASLAQQPVPSDVMAKIYEIAYLQRGDKDKGVRQAYLALLDMLVKRKQLGLLGAVKASIKQQKAARKAAEQAQAGQQLPGQLAAQQVEGQLPQQRVVGAGASAQLRVPGPAGAQVVAV